MPPFLTVVALTDAEQGSRSVQCVLVALKAKRSKHKREHQFSGWRSAQKTSTRRVR
eukprot:SAG22_NODE_31_length_27697_cov_7.384376_6_plen_56_part_00